MISHQTLAGLRLEKKIKTIITTVRFRQEVKEALKMMSGSKAVGRDNISIEVWTIFWR